MSPVATSSSWRNTSSKARFVTAFALSATAHAVLLGFCVVSLREDAGQRELGAECIVVELLPVEPVTKRQSDAESPRTAEEELPVREKARMYERTVGIVTPAKHDVALSDQQRTAESVREQMTEKPSSNMPSARARVISRSGAEKDPYWDRVRRRIAARLEYPPECRALGIAGRVVVRVSIAADGRVISARVVSGRSQQLARSVIRAVYRAAPFEPPPMNASSVEFLIPVIFQIE